MVGYWHPKKAAAAEVAPGQHGNQHLDEGHNHGL
jgi:hypothetical protein